MSSSDRMCESGSKPTLSQSAQTCNYSLSDRVEQNAFRFLVTDSMCAECVSFFLCGHRVCLSGLCRQPCAGVFFALFARCPKGLQNRSGESDKKTLSLFHARPRFDVSIRAMWCP